MSRISSFFSMGNWKTRMTMTMSLAMGTTPPRKTMMMSRLRRTWWQGVSCAPGCLKRTTTEMTVVTPMMQLIVMTAPPVMMVLEVMVATGVAATAMSAQVLRSSVVGS
jgi:hypothetical protein